MFANGVSCVYEVSGSSHKVLLWCWPLGGMSLSLHAVQERGRWTDTAVGLAGDFAQLGSKQILILAEGGEVE